MTVNDDDPELPAQPELDALLDVLRQPARPDELLGEQEAVAAMAAALASSHQEGLAPVPISKHSRKLAAVGVAAALILGGVTAAAASVLSGSPDNRVEIPATPSSSSSSTSTSTSTTTSTSVPETSTSSASTTSSTAATSTTAATEPETDDNDTKTATSIDCPDDVRNHGDFVSDVARDTPPGPDHGETVSAAARSDCGKDDTTASSVTEPGTSATTDDHGGDEDHRGPGRDGDDDAATSTSVPTTGTTATTDDHSGEDHSGSGQSGGDNSGSGSSDDSSGHGS